ncbi:uncharacterized protein LOC119689719 [Teleopsis dalmanni]|uniref:uncharacterized protein LOC119689719 n=1 Tax=Teleopsis dalmanni TaxID=139649 RepID=UPI0018CF89CB|nr:uncharacterized protein LOC119689719 [Teleopsis dalmanni]
MELKDMMTPPIILGILSAVFCTVFIMAAFGLLVRVISIMNLFIVMSLFAIGVQFFVCLLFLFHPTCYYRALYKFLLYALDHYCENGWKITMDFVQKTFKCCGVVNPMDYKKGAEYEYDERVELPISCCGNITDTDPITCNLEYNIGCNDVIVDLIGNNLTCVIVAAFAIIVIQIFFVIFLCQLSHLRRPRTRPRRCMYHRANK